jgi:hypothetical protein
MKRSARVSQALSALSLRLSLNRLSLTLSREPLGDSRCSYVASDVPKKKAAADFAAENQHNSCLHKMLHSTFFWRSLWRTSAVWSAHDDK